VFLKSAEIDQFGGDTLFHGKSHLSILTKIGLGYILGDFLQAHLVNL
jgi:hypothetical protein